MRGLTVVIVLLIPLVAFAGWVEQQAVVNVSSETWDYSMAGGDINGDGQDDVVMSAMLTGIGWVEYLGNDQWSTPVTITTNLYATKLKVFDIDNDGDQDLVGCSWRETGGFEGLAYWLNYNNGNYWHQVIIASDVDIQTFDVGDIDDDGDVDLIAGGADASEITLYRNDGGGVLTPVLFYDNPHASFPKFIDIEDMDYDGDNDVVIGGHNLDLFWMDTDQAPVIIDTDTHVNRGIVSDIDNDFLPEVVEARQTQELWMHHGNIPGTSWTNHEPIDHIFAPLTSVDAANFPQTGTTWKKLLTAKLTAAITDPEIRIWTKGGLGWTDFVIDPQTEFGETYDRVADAQWINFNNDAYPDIVAIACNNHFTADLVAWRYTTAPPGDEIDSIEQLADPEIHVHPNPFNAATSVRVTLPTSAELNVRVFNTNGQLVATLSRGLVDRGDHQFSLDAGSMASGVYFVHVQAPGLLNQVQKVLLVR